MASPPETTIGETTRIRIVRDETQFRIDFTLIPLISFYSKSLGQSMGFLGLHTPSFHIEVTKNKPDRLDKHGGNGRFLKPNNPINSLILFKL
jgi:hypothetical protein